MTQKEIAALLRAYHAAKIAADKAKDIGEQLKAEMRRQGKNELTGGGFVARLTPVDGVRFDTKAFQAEHSKLYSQYTIPTHTERLYFK